MILPELSELVSLRGAAHGLSLHAHRSALAQLKGGHRSAQRGRGLEFEEVRLYSAGDDARAIDWRVTARRGKPHTKLFREERERPVWIVADLHPGLYFGSRRQFKSALLLRAAALLAWVAALGGDRVGAVITDSADSDAMPRILPARGREAGVLPILAALAACQPRAPGAGIAGNLQRALTAALPLLQPGSLLLVLSDFASLGPRAEADLAVEDLLRAAAARCDCRLLWLTDPLERSGLPAGAHRVGLPRRLSWMDGNGSRAAWQAAWAEREQRLTGLASKLNVPLIGLDTADALPDTLIDLLKTPKWAA